MGSGVAGGQASVRFEPHLILELSGVWARGFRVLFPGCSSFSPGPTCFLLPGLLPAPLTVLVPGWEMCIFVFR